jgi:hypothetical protein
MIVRLQKTLEAQGFQCVRLDGGLIVSLPKVTIVIGKDADHESLMVQIQDETGEETEFSSFDKLQQPAVLELCEQYRKPEATVVDRPDLIGLQ